MALLAVDNSTDRVNYGSAAILDTMPIASVVLWIYPLDVSNSLREFCSKNLAGAPNGWNIFRTAANGTNYRLQLNRAVSNQQINTGNIMVANLWQYLVFTWNAPSGGPKCYRGTLNAPAVDVSTDTNEGSGAQVDDSASSLTLISRDGTASGALPARFGMLGIWNRNITPREVRELQFAPEPTSGCVLLSFPGEFGTGVQHDRSRKGNNGTVTGATYARAAELDAVFMSKRLLWASRTVGAAAGSIVGKRVLAGQSVHRASYF